MKKRRRECRELRCTKMHISSTGFCAQHRSQFDVLRDADRIRFAGRTYTLDEAIRLADAIIDAVEVEPR